MLQNVSSQRENHKDFFVNRTTLCRFLSYKFFRLRWLTGTLNKTWIAWQSATVPKLYQICWWASWTIERLPFKKDGGAHQKILKKKTSLRDTKIPFCGRRLKFYSKGYKFFLHNIIQDLQDETTSETQVACFHILTSEDVDDFTPWYFIWPANCT